MKRFSKVALGAIAVAVGAVSVGAVSLLQAKTTGVKAADTTVTQTYAYSDATEKFGGFTFSDFTDSSGFYLVPDKGSTCLIHKAGVLGPAGISVDKTKPIVITINHATYGSGINPSDSTFAFYNETSGTGTAITGTKSGSLATSSTYVDVLYTFAANAFAGNDFCIKVTKPGKKIRFKSFSIQYTKAAIKTVSSISLSGTLSKTTYYVGDVFDPAGLTVTATYNDSTTDDVTASVTWSDPVLGQNFVTATYISGATVTCQSPTITVSDVVLSKIEITTQATKASYAVGDNLDSTGLVVTGTYNSGKTEDVTSKCTITPANGSVLSTAGTIAVQISYLGKTTSYNVTVEAPTHTLKKVTSTDQLVVGAEIVILSNTTMPVAVSKTQNTNNRGETSASPSSDTLGLLNSSEAAVFTLGAGTAAGTYSLHDTNGYLYAGSSSNNVLKSEDTLDTNGNGNWDIKITAGVATLTAEGTNTRNVIQYNSTSSIFSCYSSASQKEIVLYEQATYYNAASWAIDFNTALDTTCSNTAPTAISSATWSAQNTSYSNLGTDEKTILKGVDLASYNANASIKQAISRYDYIMGKNDYSSFVDFIGRFPSRGVSPSAFATATDGKNFVLPLVTVLATTGAIALFLISKKKKHE